MSLTELLEMVEGIKSQEFLAVGDPILDEFQYFEHIRDSRERPGPVLRQVGTPVKIAGGVCNLAANGVSLGCKTTVAGAIGNDEAGVDLQSLLETRGIDPTGLVVDKSRRTSKKVRCICDNRPEYYHEEQFEDVHPASESIQNEILSYLVQHLAPVIIVSDYGRGSVPPTLIQRIVQLGQSNRRILVDPRPSDHINWKKAYRGAFLVKPNIQEAKWMTGIEVDDDETAEKAGRIIAETLESNVLLTRDCQGMTLVRRHGPGLQVRHFPARSNIVSCAVGAGDTVLATLALCLSAGYDLLEAVELSTYTAAISVAKPHTSVVHAEELRHFLDGETIEDIIRQAA